MAVTLPLVLRISLFNDFCVLQLENIDEKGELEQFVSVF